MSQTEPSAEPVFERATAAIEGTHQQLSRLQGSQVDKWKIHLWTSLMEELHQEFVAVNEYHNRREVSPLAWMTRNLLELSVWFTYCSGSVQNAQTFYGDRNRDLRDFLKHSKMAFSLPKEPDPEVIHRTDLLMQELKQMHNEEFGLIEDSFTRVCNAAKAVGLDRIFLEHNKLLSKFAHPTAMMILSRPSANEREGFCTFFGAVAGYLVITCAGIFVSHMAHLLGNDNAA